MLRFTTRNKVSRLGVPIALVSTDTFSVGNNIGTFDLSHRIPENRLSRRVNFPVAGSVEYQYNPVDRLNQLMLNVTDLQSTRSVVTNKTAIRPDLARPIPLFYKYTLGRGDKYVYQRPPVDADEWRELVIAIQTGQLTAVQVQSYKDLLPSITLAIRDNISITTRMGAETMVVFDIARIMPVSINSMSEHFGCIFDVTIYTSERCANGTTLMVNYPAYDIKNDRLITAVSEVLNAEPVHQKTFASYGATDQLEVVDATTTTPVSRKQYSIKFILDE